MSESLTDDVQNVFVCVRFPGSIDIDSDFSSDPSVSGGIEIILKHLH